MRFSRSIVACTICGMLVGIEPACSIDDRFVGTGPSVNGSTEAPPSVSSAAPSASAAASGGADASVASDMNGVPANERAVSTANGPALSSAAGMSMVNPPVERVDAGLPVTVLVGHVIDFYRRPVPGVAVRVGASSTMTDAAGAFTFGSVRPPYDASVLIDTTTSGMPAHAEYVYQDLRRSDPTLQVYKALPEHSASFQAVLTNPNVPSDEVLVAFDPPGADFPTLLQTNPGVLGTTTWTGSVALQGTAHALEISPNTSTDNQISILATADVPVASSDGDSARLSFALAAANVETIQLVGNVRGGTLGDPQNLLVLRLSDGTSFSLDGSQVDPSTFAYSASVPLGSALIVAAENGSAAPSAHAIVHQENIGTGETSIQLILPDPVTLTEPPSNATGDASTTFAWSAAGQKVRSFVWHLRLAASLDEVFVVTNRTSLSLSDLPPGFTWAADTAAQWSVQTHGDGDTIDVFAGPNGFMDAFSFSPGISAGIPSTPSGPNHADGYFTETELRGVTLH